MTNTGAEAGEHCHQCRTAMNVGAVVCTGCGAERQISRYGPLVILGGIMTRVAISTSIFAGLWLFFRPGPLALLALIGPWVLTIGLFLKAPQRVSYDRPRTIIYTSSHSS